MTAKQLSLAVVMDPIASITPYKDSTLAMLLAAQARGSRLIYFTQQGLSVRDGVAIGTGRELRVQDDNESWFSLGDAWEGRLGNLDVILMRKDPPFDMEYVHTTYILERAEHDGAWVVNRPRSLRDMNEKAFTAWFPNCTPPTLITRSRERILAFLAEHGHVVIKPLDGMGGRSIFVVRGEDVNRNVIIETMTENGGRFIIAQRYVPEITQGDKRILMIDGEPVPRLLARVPSEGDFRGNLVMGARGEGRELSERDRWICDQVGPVLRERGILFAGLDVIGDYLTEINVTSPTGIRELDRQFQLDIGGMLMDAIAERAGT